MTAVSLAVVKRRLSGVAFLAIVVGLVALTVALYNKAFTPVVTVTLQASKAGNQLSAPSDVKLNGLIVGEVRNITTTGDGAELELALDPDQVELIPADVEARLLPKTLFGEKYVALVAPPGSTADPIAEGDVITSDRSEVARETEETLNDLLPLLQALKPAQVSTTLNALSSALRGRGDQLGSNLELVDSYLKEFNPEIPTLGEDFRGIADFADNLEQTTPDLLELLDNLSAINRNLVDQEQELERLPDLDHRLRRGDRQLPGRERAAPGDPGRRLAAVAAAVRQVRPRVPVPGARPRGQRQDHRRHVRRAPARSAHHARVHRGPDGLRARSATSRSTRTPAGRSATSSRRPSSRLRTSTSRTGTTTSSGPTTRTRTPRQRRRPPTRRAPSPVRPASAP